MSRHVLITGACGGIGRVLCQRFCASGDIVYAQDLASPALTQLVAELNLAYQRHHPEPVAHAIAADLCQPAALNAALAEAADKIEVLVANAGAATDLTLQQTSWAGWQADINLNLHGTFQCVEAVRGGMQARGGGAIVMIGSVNGLHALGHPAYSAAKAALISYTKSLALELGKFGIRSNIVCPGTVKTQAWQARVEKNPQVFDDLKKWYPLGDFATPDDIADAVQFLASPAARVITGVVLPVDGGLMAGNQVFARELTQEEI